MRMRWRTALAAVLATAAVWVPLAVALVERHVTALAEHAEPGAEFAGETRSPLEYLGPGSPWIWLAAAAVLLVLWRRDPHRWPVPAIITGVAVPYTTHALHHPGVAELDGIWGRIGTAPTGVIVPLTAAVTVGAVWLGAHLITSPLGADLARSSLTISLGSRGGAGTLRLRHDRLVLATKPHELALPWPSITLVQAGVLTHDAEWVQPHGSVATLLAGPALRVAGAEQQWLVRVADAATAREMIEQRRRACGGQAPPPPDPRRWHEAVNVVAEDQKRAARMRLRTLGGGSPHFMLLGGSVGLALAAISLLTIPEPDWKLSYLWATAFFGGFGSFALYVGLRVRSARELLSRWPKAPGAERSAPTDPATMSFRAMSMH